MTYATATAVYSDTADCDMITIHSVWCLVYDSVDTMKYCPPHYDWIDPVPSGRGENPDRTEPDRK